MRFTVLTPEEFTEYGNQSPYRSFAETTEIATLREKSGWVPYYLGIKDEKDKILAATLLVAKPTFLGKSTFIAPGGPLLDFEEEALTTYFIKSLRSFIKSHNGYVLQISPNYELIERDRDGNPIPNGFNRRKARGNLSKLGFIEITSSQPKYQFAMDIENRTIDELQTDLKRNTRNHIRKAEKAGVKIRELNRDELSKFKKITESTSERRHFEDRPLSYYEEMYDLFHDKKEIMYLLAETPDGKTPLSAAMFMLYGDEIIYLFSGSDEKYMREFNAQYLIQWHMIKYAADHHFKRYNFYGISGLPKNGDLDGIYEFKKGFDTKHGKVIELIGTYELKLSLLAHLHAFLSKIKNRK